MCTQNLNCVRLQVIQDKLLKGLKISPEERSQLGKRRVYQLELDALETSALASEMTVEEEVTERQRRHEAKLAKQGIKVGQSPQRTIWLVHEYGSLD